MLLIQNSEFIIMITGIIHDSRRVDKFTSRQVNQLLVDRVNKRQSNR